MQLTESASELAHALAEASASRDADRVLPHEEMRQVKASGLLAARIAREHGGPDTSYVDLAAAVAELSAGDPNVGQAIQPHFFFIEFLRLEGNEAQQTRYSAEVAKGALLANAFAERGGKYIGETNTSIKRNGRNYRLNGCKYYSTGSLFADLLYATAVNEDGVVSLVVFPPSRDGVKLIDDWDGMGQRTTASGTTQLNDVEIAGEEIIPLPTLGKQRVYVGSAAQLVHSAIDVGIAKAAFADSVGYAPRSRPVAESGVDKATDDPYVIHAVGEMATLVHCAEAMLARAGAAVDAAARAQLGKTHDGADLDRILSLASVAVAEAKAVSNMASLQVSEMMYRVGGAGMTARKYNFDRHWRNARTHTTHDPVAYKYRAIGDYYLNDRFPPISTKI